MPPKRKTKKKAKKTGRPRAVIDLGLVEKLATIHCTDVEIAAALSVSVDTITRRKKETSFAEAHTRGLASGKRSLRRKQFDVAMAGNVRMLEWLGKQYLDQSDRRVIAGDDDAPVRVTFDDLAKKLVPELTGDGT
jgi:hypothetical protein